MSLTLNTLCINLQKFTKMNRPTWKKIFCKDALLPIGWTKDVLIEIDLTGTIISITPNSKKKMLKCILTWLFLECQMFTPMSIKLP